MTRWASFVYREFYDVPRAILARDGSETYYFDCPFDEMLDDYRAVYSVYRMPQLSADQLAGSWEGLEQRALGFLGTCPVRSVKLDPTNRKEIDLDVLSRLDP